MSIPDELRKLVEADKRTREAIAKAAKISPVRLSRFMNNHYDLRLDALQRLAKVLGGSVRFVRRK